jgi:predicted ferric reductase
MRIPLKLTLPLLAILAALGGLWLLNDSFTPHFWKKFGLLLGWLGFICFSFSFILALRTRWLDQLSDGLDKAFTLHHRLGEATLLFLIGHMLALSMRWLSLRPAKAFWFPFPVHAKYWVNLGIYGFWVLVLLLLLTFWTRVPYRQWKWTHRLMGFPLVLGTLHVALNPDSPLRVWTVVIGSLGVAAWLWELGLRRLIFPWATYRVVKIERPTPRHAIVTIRAANRNVNIQPGQYVFVQFDSLGWETHPFTPFVSPDGDLCLTIKVSGDYTRRLYMSLRVGAQAKVSSAYGTFSYTRGGKSQVWIAGGVGIAPFISWAQHKPPGKVQLFYCVHSKEDALHIPLLKDIDVQLICTKTDGHLTAKQVQMVVSNLQAASIFLCGPPEMAKDLERQLRQIGCPPTHLHSEIFAFRGKRIR